MGKPAIILTSQFSVPNRNSFNKYVSYMTRKHALESKGLKNNIEARELKLIEKAVNQYEFDYDSSDIGGLANNHKEATNILLSKSHFDTNNQFEKYITYMTRKQALDKKEKLTTEEEKEKEVVRKFLAPLSDPNEAERENPIVLGTFSHNKKILRKSDLVKVSKVVGEAQKNGSVFYQDVISFDNKFLIERGIYDKETDQLDENRLRAASHKMMEKMFEDEKIENGYWFASIHRNTDNIHIHYGTVENRNTRSLISVNNGKYEVLEPKGKRKQSTLDNMKTTFANSLIDRSSELSRISNLRNELVKDIRVSLKSNKKSLKEMKLIEEIRRDLPANKRYWQYGSSHVSNETRNKIDQLTESMMKNSPDYKEYLTGVKQEQAFRRELFGESKREDKDYELNKKNDIKKRMGNALLKELKNNEIKKDSTKKAFKKVYGKEASKGSLSLNKIKHLGKTNLVKPIITDRNLTQIKRSLNQDLNKQRAARDYEVMQNKINGEKTLN